MIRGVLLDISGVLCIGDQPLPGATEAVSTLRASDIPVRFVTNITRTPRRGVLDRLAGMGFDIPENALFTAPMAAREYLLTHHLRPYLLVHPWIEGEFADLSTESPNAVLVGDAGPLFTYERLNRAFRLLMEGKPLLAMGCNRYFTEEDGLSLDAGPFVAALEYAAGVRATVFGKPAPAFFEAAVTSLGCLPTEAVMVGDDALVDVEGALLAGLQAILVQTGKYRPGDERQIQAPGAVVLPDLPAAAERIIRKKGGESPASRCLP